MLSKNTPIQLGLIIALISAFGGAAWKAAQAIVQVEQNKQDIKEFRSTTNEKLDKLVDDVSFIRGYLKKERR